ncbi:hypothetical protein HMPREF1141_3394 [Clostridium sp. MSTE9]|nr:hypothetical protein HMPREF1141_3394 [Clostridium sp. MSTE9]
MSGLGTEEKCRYFQEELIHESMKWCGLSLTKRYESPLFCTSPGQKSDAASAAVTKIEIKF